MEKTYNVATLSVMDGMGTPLKITPGLSVGRTVNDMSAASSLRPKVANEPIRISSVALAVQEMLLNADKMIVAELGDSLYVEYEASKYLIRAVDAKTSDSEGVEISGCYQVLPPRIILMLHALWSIAKGPVRELRMRFLDMVSEMKRVGYVMENLVAGFCDTYYYGCCRNQTITYNDELLVPEIQAVSRAAGGPKEVEIFEEAGLGIPHSSDTVKVVKESKPKRTRTKKAAPSNDPLKDAKDGKYLVSYEWKEEQEPYIQKLSSLDTFIPNPVFFSLLEKIRLRTDKVLSRMDRMTEAGRDIDRVEAIGNDYINVTLTGKPGTGKTRLAYALAAATGMPVYTISCSHNTDEDEFTGMTKMVDGKPTAVPTDCVRCFENGGIMLLEEINLPQAAVVMGALGQGVEFPFILKKDGYIPIRRHPLCIIISTMNTGTAGAKVLSQPFANRFKQSFVMNDPKRAEFIRILQNTGAPRKACAWVYAVYERIVNCISDENAMADVESILLSLSMRSCIGALENMQEGMEAREAIRNSIIGKIAEQDMEVAETCDKVLLSCPDPNFDIFEDE